MPRSADDMGIDPTLSNRISAALAKIDAGDLERIEPPADLWDGIAAAVSNEAGVARTGPGTVVEYAIDADDVVFSVGESWADFARENEAPELAEPEPRRTLWSNFDREEVRDLWRLLVGRVRTTGAEARVPLRCDGPDERRWFEMTITPRADGVVHFRSVMVFEEPRAAVSLLGRYTERDATAPAVPVCIWCGQGHDGNSWHDIEDLVRNLRLLESAVPSIDYGICPSCRDLMSADLLVTDASRDTRD